MTQPQPIPLWLLWDIETAWDTDVPNLHKILVTLVHYVKLRDG
jgi:hypothetical protein